MFDNNQSPGGLLDQYSSGKGNGSLLDQYSSTSGGSIFDQKGSSSIYSKTSALDLVSSGGGSPFDNTSPLKGGSIFDTLNMDKSDPYQKHQIKDSVFDSKSSVFDTGSVFDGAQKQSSIFDSHSSNNSSIFTSSPFEQKGPMDSPFSVLGSSSTNSQDSSPFSVLGDNNSSQDNSPFSSLNSNYSAPNYGNQEKQQSFTEKYKKDEPAKKSGGGLFSKSNKPKESFMPSQKMIKKEESEDSPVEEHKDDTQQWKDLDKKHVISSSKGFIPPASVKEEVQENKEDTLFRKKIISVAEQMSDQKLYELSEKLTKEIGDSQDMKKEIKLKVIKELLSDRQKSI